MIFPDAVFLQGDAIGNMHSYIPSSSVYNLSLPGSRNGASVWNDKSGGTWLLGGYGYDAAPIESPRYLADLWYANDSTNSWQLIDNPCTECLISNSRVRRHPKPRRNAVMCGVPGIVLVLFGGEGNNGVLFADTWLYSILQHQWLPLFASASKVSDKEFVIPQHPSARSQAVVWCLEDTLIMFGGQGVNAQFLDDLWSFSLKNLTWHQIEQETQIDKITADLNYGPFPLGRAGAFSWYTDQKLYLYGGLGSTNNNFVLLNDIWQFSLITLSWYYITVSNNTSLIPLPRHNGISFSFKKLPQSIGILGGLRSPSLMSEDVQFIGDVWTFNIVEKFWTRHNISYCLQNSGNILERSHVASWLNDDKSSLFIFSGMGFDQRHKLALLNEMWQLTLSDLNVSCATSLKYFSHNIKLFNYNISLWIVLFLTLFFCSLTCLGIFIYFRKHNQERFKVRYSKLKNDIAMDT